MKETKPHTLRSGVSRSVTVNNRLYVLHQLCAKDTSVPAKTFKHPVRIMDFDQKKLHKVDYLNDDSSGTVNGESSGKPGVILPQIHRINYSLCRWKNKVFIYGGLSEFVK